MAVSNANPPGILNLLRKVALTGLGALENRGELFLVELQEEKNRVIELFIWAAAFCFLGIMFIGVLTATIILIFPDDLRVYAAGGFALLYLIGACLSLLNLKALVKHAVLPFADTIAEVNRDREWLDSLK
ncbi:MAG: hypothetical protein JWQ04_2224 [Pedosphaera sp.]|nr:hypothetical protein [Pedosphaera sp.]